MFSDLRDFSGLSEGMSAQELTLFMNGYLTPMTDAILDSEGTIDKYVGDAIVAFWNAPLDVADHPRKAGDAPCWRCAPRSLRSTPSAPPVPPRRAAPHRPAAMGIGLNLGPCSVGNMGSTRRFDYSILGDDVNLASRLEGLCKTFRIDIIASGAVRDAAPDLAWLELGEAIVVGRRAPTQIFALAGDAARRGERRPSPTGEASMTTMMASYLAASSRRARDAAARAAAPESSRIGVISTMGCMERFAALEAGAASGEDWTPAWTFGEQVTFLEDVMNEMIRRRFWRRIEAGA